MNASFFMLLSFLTFDVAYVLLEIILIWLEFNIMAVIN